MQVARFWECELGFLPICSEMPGPDVVLRFFSQQGRRRRNICQVAAGGLVLSMVPEGTVVKTGDLLCELDASELRDRLTRSWNCDEPRRRERGSRSNTAGLRPLAMGGSSTSRHRPE
jgi:hypothetical protein